MSSSEPSKRTIDVVDTELPADSVEFCPRDGSRNILVCGTYNLVKNDEDADSSGSKRPQTRNGRCLVYEVGENSQKLKEVHRIETAAILDLKWSYDDTSSNPILALAESVGSIRIYEWHRQEKKLLASQVIQAADPHTLCLSIDWNNRVSSQGGHRLIVSKSDGGLSVLKPSESRMEVDRIWHAHDFEPWIAAWNYWTPQVAYSGGDDCKLKGWDTRTSCDSPIFINKRFEAGVTCIQTHPYVEYIVAVGSYDNTVRIFDSRKMSAPVADVDVGGGAWRVKWHPSVSRKDDLLVACMHDGFKVVRCPIKDNTAAGMIDPPVTTSFYNAHTSLAYGVDWKHGTSPDGSPESMVASCSFYDHVLHLWSS
ncbi:hypothetical protein FS749_009485 [Ceratobasidium sp. UAMH 11750]|nr:hypothetical protein FS749_009485 [Ceratobasidium sp. UAMH 11750]